VTNIVETLFNTIDHSTIMFPSIFKYFVSKMFQIKLIDLHQEYIYIYIMHFYDEALWKDL
jgi:hypothetical protein